MKRENSGDIIITIPSTLLQNIHHLSSHLENMQDSLSWLIHLLRVRGVDAYLQDDNDALPKPSGQGVDACPQDDNVSFPKSSNCFDAPGVYLIYNNDKIPSECLGCPNYVEPDRLDVTCTGDSSDCDDCPNYVPIPDVCKACPTFVKRIWGYPHIFQN